MKHSAWLAAITLLVIGAIAWALSFVHLAQRETTPSCLQIQENLVNSPAIRILARNGKATANSHFNNRLGNCAVEIKISTTDVIYDELWQAPQPLVAICTSSAGEGTQFAGELPSCKIAGDDQPNISKEQFDSLRNKYMTE
jgi:hypothetical protein